MSVINAYINKINKITGRSESLSLKDLQVHFNHKLLLPLPLVEDLTLQEYARLVEEIEVESPVQIYTDTARYYPYSTAASHTLGYVTQEKDKKNEGLKTFRIKRKEGKTGLEKEFDNLLMGQSGGEVWLVDHRGFQYSQIEKKIPIQGNRLHTSLDIDIQRSAEEAMGDKIGAVVAIKVKTGEVIVLASKPNYDLNELTPFIPTLVFNKINDNGAWLNRATQGLYPPGSTFKIITAIAGLKNGIMSTDTEVDCEGSLWNMACWNRRGHNHISLAESLAQSCNVYYYYFGVKTTIENLSAEAKLFGLNDPTGIELPNETSRMIVPDPDWKKANNLGSWRRGDTANMAIGQGYLRITPLQMACFTASLARKETMTRPSLLYQSEDSLTNNDSLKIDMSDEDYQTIIYGMARAVTSGTAKNSRIQGLNIAAKTGTAQVPVHGEKLTIAWYIGFAPIEDPEIAVCVTIEGPDPNDNFNGGKTAAPIAKVVMEEYKNRYMN
jgi:penicillin-binding protein 2